MRPPPTDIAGSFSANHRFPENSAQPDFTGGKCLHHLFEEQAERTPDAVALVHEGRSMTFRELDDKAERLARQLLAMGAGPDFLIGICIERSLEMVVGLLGILKAGAAFLPLDPGYPPERLALIMKISGNPPVLRTRSAWLPPEVNTIDYEELMDTAPQTTGASQPVSPESLAYVLFTSGSTGQPKGVMVSHRSIVNHMLWMQQRFPVDASDRVLQKTPVSFDASLWEIFLPLMSGARMVLAIQDGHRDPGYLIDHILLERVTVVQFVPSLLELFAEHPRMYGCKSLRRIFSGGEALGIALCERVFERLNVELVNLYGPTETTIDASYWVCQRGETGLLAPIGKPVENTQLHVFDAERKPVASGVTGELFISGAQVARGYLNAPELTAERFFNGPQGRLYQTGDLARLRPDGNLEFLGRTDHQVKIRGHRIELGEIEAALRTHPDIGTCAVITRSFGNPEKSIAAFVVGQDGIDLSMNSLRDWLGKKLPDYMIPERFFPLPALPLTPNGKLDRLALSTAEAPAPGPDKTLSQPKDLLELELIRIWQKLFHRESIDRNDHFLELGGHSLLAARLVLEIEKLTGVKLPIAALLQSPTIEALASRLTKEDAMPAWKSLVPLQPLGSKPPLFLVHGWGGDVYGFLDLAKAMGPDQPVYGIQAVGLDGKHDRHASVEEMAAYYVREIRSHQAEGPYFLGGYSLGGLIAFEVAIQLKQQGQQVAMLAIIETEPIGGISWSLHVKTMVRQLRGRIPFHLRQMWRMPSTQRFGYFTKRLSVVRSWISRNQSKPLIVDELPAAEDYYQAITSTYRLRRYHGAVDFFVSNDADPYYAMCWNNIARNGFTLHKVQGDHFQILTPSHVDGMAYALKSALARGRARASS